MVRVTADMIRNRLNLTEDDISDDKIEEMIKDAAATLAVETNRDIDYVSCSDIEAIAIKNLAAIYVLCHLSGGSAVGLNFTVGDVRVDSLGKSPSIDILYRELERIILKLRFPSVESV
jgi:hypothetical protein